MSLQLRERRCQRVATTLAVFSDDLHFQRQASNLGAPLTRFRGAMWGKARKDPLVGTHNLTFERADEMTQKKRDFLFTELSRMERIARAVDAAAGQRGTKVRVDAFPEEAEDSADHRRALSPPTSVVFLLPALRGSTETVWDAPAARLVRLPLPLFLFHGGAEDRSGKREMEIMRSSCIGSGMQASALEAVEHREGVTMDGFVRAAVTAAEDAAAIDAGAYRIKLLREAQLLGCDVLSDTALPALVRAIARNMYRLQAGAFLSSDHGAPKSAAAASGTGRPAKDGAGTSGKAPPEKRHEAACGSSRLTGDGAATSIKALPKDDDAASGSGRASREDEAEGTDSDTSSEPQWIRRPPH